MGESPFFRRFLPHLGTRQSVAWRYGGAVLISLAFIALRWLMGRVFDDGVPFAVLFIPVALSAFYGGLGPGLVSVLTTITLADYFLIPPLYTVGLPDTQAVVYTLLFAISGLIVSALGEVGRNAVLQASSEAEVRKIAQEQSLANEERLRITEQVVSGGVWDWDVAHNSLYWSDGFQRLCDYPLTQKPSHELWVESLHPEDRGYVLGQLDELFQQRLHNWSMEYRIRTASGRTRWVESRAQVFYDDAGKPRRMVGINLDITARRFADGATRESNVRLRTG
ncbi:MAG TPA: PAS domain-containing protein [Candidatus Eisenbacteria bacterium]|nr:PAS domain-containing protein [Candidatus Eisenbacteria bacterium]